MRNVLLLAIRFYQRYISPRKGFCCAYRAHTGRDSCSALGFRAVRRYGVWTGLSVLRRRLYRCGVAYRRCASIDQRPRLGERGDCIPCDLPCDASCEPPNMSSCSSAGDALNLCDCGSCDGPNRKRKRNDEKEQHVHIPPHTRFRQRT